jgi:parallel beta helix pectate lyase-like protein
MTPPTFATALATAAFVLALAMFEPAAAARQLYVDSVGGSDSNPGTSADAPWHTVARVNATPLRPGDAIYFKRGGVWREMLQPQSGGAPLNPITFSSYGSGPSPVISGSDLIAGWSGDPGPIYHAKSARPGNVFVDGGPGWGLARAQSIGEMRPASWFWDAATSQLYVWLAEGVNPAGHTIEAAVRPSGFYANTADSRFANITIDGLTFERTSGFGIYFHSYAAKVGLTGIVIENNTVTQTGTGRIDYGRYDNGIFLLQEPELPAAAVIRHNLVSYTGGHGNGINCQGADNALIEANDVSNWNHNGIDVKAARRAIVRGNVVHDQTENGAGLYAEQAKDITWEQNLVYNTSNGIEVAHATSAGIFNNSIYDSATGIHVGPDAIFVSISHNALDRTKVALESPDRRIVSGDYNLWGVNPRLRIGPASYSLSEWMAMGGHSHDLSGDPMWKDPGRGNFAPLSGSPCPEINAGARIPALRASAKDAPSSLPR